MRLLLLLLFILSCDRTTSWQTPKGGDFELPSTKGVLKTSELRGKTLFIFFGFLNCPHVCPTTTRELNRMMKLLDEKEREKVVPIFISVDPARDTIPVLKERFASYDPHFVAATGTEEELRSIIAQFGGGFKIIKGQDPTDIFVDHTASVFVVNQDGVWVNSLPFDAPKEEFKRALELAPAQKPYGSEDAKEVKHLGHNDDCDLGKSVCGFQTANGKIEVEVKPRPINHLMPTQLIVRSGNPEYTPVMADIVGLELPMGLIRPKLEKNSAGEWTGNFTLPACDLTGMNWYLRLLLVNKNHQNEEIRFKFPSINI